LLGSPQSDRPPDKFYTNLKEQSVLAIILRNSILLIGVMVFAAVLLQDELGLLTAAVKHSQSEQAASPGRASRSSPDTDYASADGSELVVEAGAWGHFHVDAEIDGREIGFLVDTGASMVALSEEDADTIGYPIYQLDYSGRANTANGVARIAPIMIDEIVIGDHIVSNVQAVVIEGHTGKSLLGMTFLRRLAGFEIKDNRLYLRW
jgi:aspartyl protease family protein